MEWETIDRSMYGEGITPEMNSCSVVLRDGGSEEPRLEYGMRNHALGHNQPDVHSNVSLEPEMDL